MISRLISIEMLNKNSKVQWTNESGETKIEGQNLNIYRKSCLSIPECQQQPGLDLHLVFEQHPLPHWVGQDQDQCYEKL